MLRPVAVAALLLLAAPGSASLLESTTSDALEQTPIDHLHYQADAGTEHDAPDTCGDALASALPLDLSIGGSFDGLLVPVDDEVDHYRVPIGQDLVGGRVTLSVAGRDATLPLAIEAFMPFCGSSVTAPENQPAPPPRHPAPGEGEVQVAPHNLDGSHQCSGRWFFVLNQFGGSTPPASIHVVWTDGSQQDVPLLKGTPATLAQYATSEHLRFTVDSATANVPADWKGQFNLSEGPCDAVDGEAVFGEPAAVEAGNRTIRFTPIEAGVYVLAVRALPPEAPQPPPLVTSSPASCHAICGAAPRAGMDLSGYTAAAS